MTQSFMDDSFEFKRKPEANYTDNIFSEQILRPKRDYELEDALSRLEEK